MVAIVRGVQAIQTDQTASGAEKTTIGKTMMNLAWLVTVTLLVLLAPSAITMDVVAVSPGLWERSVTAASLASIPSPKLAAGPAHVTLPVVQMIAMWRPDAVAVKIM